MALSISALSLAGVRSFTWVPLSSTVGVPAWATLAVKSSVTLVTQPRYLPLVIGASIAAFEGVLVARQYVLMDYDVRVELVEKACLITPGLESPTVSPLHDQGWVAVRAMVRRDTTNQVMDDLWTLGARGILVTGIHACRL